MTPYAESHTNNQLIEREDNMPKAQWPTIPSETVLLQKMNMPQNLSYSESFIYFSYT